MGNMSPEWNRLLELEEKTIRRAFYIFIGKMRSPATLAYITRLLRTRNVNAAMAFLKQHLREFADAHLSQSFYRMANAEVQQASRKLHRVRKSLRKQVDLEFDENDPQAVDLVRSSSLDFINDFTRAQERTVRLALAASLSRGEGPEAAARTFRDAIGLTDNQWQAVDNYRRLLENSSSEALNRTLRDRRYDTQVRGAIERGDVLNEDQINRMVDRYTDSMLDFRAQNIARTESHRAMSQARHAAWGQILDQVGATPDQLTRTWVATEDARTRDTHREMDGQQVQGLDEPYQSPSGAQLMHPGDRSAPPEETINCRCTEAYDLAA